MGAGLSDGLVTYAQSTGIEALVRGVAMGDSGCVATACRVGQTQYDAVQRCYLTQSRRCDFCTVRTPLALATPHWAMQPVNVRQWSLATGYEYG